MPNRLIDATTSAVRMRPSPVALWSLAVRIAPGLPTSHVGLVRALRRSFQLERAQQTLGSALRLFPGNAEVQAEAAHLVQAWADIEQLAPVEVTRVADDATKRLLLGFESVGSSCEFGLVQRRFGAEPLGLFRWNTVGSGQLIRGLEQGFAGLGDPANTELYQAPTGEYLVRDRRWGFGMHTWMYPGQIDVPDLERQMCDRLAFLRDKFLDDLRRSKKVFVYRSFPVELTKLQAVLDALRLHGPARLLAVQPCHGPERRPRDVVRAGDGFCLGFVRPNSDAREWDIPYDEWVDICKKTMSML